MGVEDGLIFLDKFLTDIKRFVVRLQIAVDAVLGGIVFKLI